MMDTVSQLAHAAEALLVLLSALASAVAAFSAVLASRGTKANSAALDRVETHTNGLLAAMSKRGDDAMVALATSQAANSATMDALTTSQAAVAASGKDRPA